MPPSEAPTISTPIEDYVKAIYSLTRGDRETAATSDLAQRLDISRGSVSTMLRRLDETGLAEHVPYRGVHLTPEGERVALAVIRRHRLIELFLATALEIPWQDVHGYAEALEHAASDELIEIIARKLGNPTIDPHGDPIPNHDLQIEEQDTQSLASLTEGERATLTRVSDSDPAMLLYLSEHDITIGTELQMIGRQPFDGPYEVRVGKQTHSLGHTLARAMRVRTLTSVLPEDA
jgi:DtxR family Mn-dependent transcriptional regulator